MVGDEDETPEVSEEPSHAWMLTFADLVSLMLTFFVLLYSMSSLQSDEFETLASVLSQRLNPSRDLVKESPTADLNLPTVSVPRAASLYYIQHVLRTKFEDDPTLGTLSIKRTDSELIISLPSDALFAPASATLTPAADRILSTLADALRYFTNEVSVAGHTDPNPINTPEFPSNWELSLARAAAVARALRDGGYPLEIQIFGHAATRFEELDIDIPIDERFREARRVEVIINEPEGKAK